MPRLAPSATPQAFAQSELDAQAVVSFKNSSIAQAEADFAAFQADLASAYNAGVAQLAATQSTFVQEAEAWINDILDIAADYLDTP